MSIKIINIRANQRRAITTLISVVTTALMSCAGAQETVPASAELENQAGLTLSPNGNTAFWVEWSGKWGSPATGRRVIYTARRKDNVWGEAKPASFFQQHSNDDPFVSPDGQWLYFVSDRPSDAADQTRDANIWRYNLRTAGAPEYLAVNSDAEEYSPVVTASGALYFASDRNGGVGRGDLYRAAVKDSSFAQPALLGPAVNSETGEWNLWVSAGETDLIFEASSRTTNVSVPGDLYYSWQTSSGWTPALPIKQLNTTNSDLLPRLHPNGETLFYTSAPIGGHARIKHAEWSGLRATMRATFAPTLLVANRSSHEVKFVDLASGQVVASVSTGEGPHLLSNVSSGRVAVTGYGEFPEPHAKPVAKRPTFLQRLNARMTLIDINKQTAVLDKKMDDCSKPHASWIVEQRVFMTCENEKHLLVFDLKNKAIVGKFDTLQNGSHVLSFDGGTRQLAVSNTDSNSLSLINIDNGSTRVVPLAAGSEGLLADQGVFWVSNAMDGSISIVDAKSATETKRINAVCDFPIAFGRDNSKRVWVACFASAELVAFNTDTYTEERRYSLTSQPLNILLHPSRALAYLSMPRQNAVSEIDLQSGKEVRRISVGIEPDGLRWSK